MKTGDEAQDAAADLLKMRSARIIKAATLDPEEEEMRAKTRAAMRRMKGVKLQISDERITFDDVAGIGEAKVQWCSKSVQHACWGHGHESLPSEIAARSDSLSTLLGGS